MSRIQFSARGQIPSAQQYQAITSAFREFTLSHHINPEFDPQAVVLDKFYGRVLASLASGQVPAEFDMRAATEEIFNLLQIYHRLSEMDPSDILVVVWVKYEDIQDKEYWRQKAMSRPEQP